MKKSIITTEEFIKKAIKLHGNKYDYSPTIYEKSSIKIKVKCFKHGLLEMLPHNHLKKLGGCRKCAIKIISSKRVFIQKATKKHGNKYNYELVNYINKYTKINIICFNHGSFFQKPDDHLQGKGCLQCGLISSKKKQRKTTEDFIKKSKEMHGDKYLYDKSIYLNNKTKVIIICKNHGEFEVLPKDHYRFNCQKCGYEENGKKHALSNEGFIEKAKKIHGNKYDYSNCAYSPTNKHIKIICLIHGIFIQNSNSHLLGFGCKKCTQIGFSKKEKQWLDSLNILQENRNIGIKVNNHKRKVINVDGFDPLTKTVYQFHGDFWHGNPSVFDINEVNPVTKKTFGELYNRTILKDNIIKNSGYHLVTIWEKDWDLLNE